MLILSGVLAYQRTRPSSAMWLFFASNEGQTAKIYRLHPRTYQLTDLSQYNGIDNLAGISENGDWLIFTSDRNNVNELTLYRMDWQGQSVQRIDYEQPNYQRISPDKQWQVEASVPDGDLEIVLRHRYTGEVRQITENSIPDFDPAWSSDSRQLAYVSTYYGNADIYMMLPDGSHRVRLTISPYPETKPVWSPLIDLRWHRTNWLLGSIVVISNTLLAHLLWHKRRREFSSSL